MDTKDWIDLVMSLATVFLAIFTALMAFQTKKLAEEGKESRKLMELHHQEGLAPIIYFFPNPGGLSFVWQGNPEGCRCRLNGTMTNSGSGSALNVKLIPIVPTYPQQLPTFESSPIGSLEHLQSELEEIIIGNSTDCSFLKSHQDNWKLQIDYTDLFGNPYSSMIEYFKGNELKRMDYIYPEKMLKNRQLKSYVQEPLK